MLYRYPYGSVRDCRHIFREWHGIIDRITIFLQIITGMLEYQDLTTIILRISENTLRYCDGIDLIHKS